MLTGNRKYIDAILRALNLEKSKPAQVPITTKLAVEDNEEPLNTEDHTLYRSCVGTARYLVAYVPEAIFAVHVCQRGWRSPRQMI